MLFQIIFQIFFSVEKVDDSTFDDGQFRFSCFDIVTILKNGQPLLGSAGDEFDVEDDPALQGKDSSIFFLYLRILFNILTHSGVISNVC